MYFIKKLFKKKRSVLFYRHSYYHFYYLAKALRQRGWDATCVNLESPTGDNANFYHGEDINLYNDDPVVFKKNIDIFFKNALAKYNLFHFAGDGCLSFYPEYSEYRNPPDIIKWKVKGKKVAYTISGCNSGITQKMIEKWSIADNGLSVCSRCVWQDNEEVCSNLKSVAWGEKVHEYCNLIFSETLPALDFMKSHEKVIREPVTMCLDEEVWSPNLSIPNAHKVDKQSGELLIYHSVGNYALRNNETRNIKGTPFVIKAIERLKSEGFKLKLIFVVDKKNIDVRFYQAQADIIVDQLNFGRYGANAREGMMLGKPVICYLNNVEFEKSDELISLKECPLISATESNIYEVLKNLVQNKPLREKIGNESRKYALKWHGAQRCAEKYEKIYDKLFEYV